ncbi:MAG: FitA-like ribbon-helix-helix domain-containing protein [Thermomicrobiales bacterium]
MAALTIRNLDDDVKAKLRIRAAHNGRSMEAEAREILAEAVDSTDSSDSENEIAGPHGSYAVSSSTTLWNPDVDVDGSEAQDVSDPKSTDSYEDDFVQNVRRRFLAIGGVDLDIPPRTEMPHLLDFGGPERDADGEQIISADAADLSNPGGPQSTGGRSKIMATLAAMGIDEVLAELSPQQVEETRRLVYDDGPPNENVGQAFLRVFKSLGGVRLESPRSGREARWVDFSG